MDRCNFEIEPRDEGRLRVNRRFAAALDSVGLGTFESVFNFAGGKTVRRVGNRSTVQLHLGSGGARQSFFLKRHGAPSLADCARPVLHLSRPILGARNEWEAILRFHAAGIPTLTPVAFGQSQGRSFVMTEDLDADRTLLDWVNGPASRRLPPDDAASSNAPEFERELLGHVAGIARRMHQAGLYHQDFYLNHMLWRDGPGGLDIRIIDLGRVRERKGFAMRWVLKDLAQLDYSARKLSCAARLRFLRLYLGRPFQPSDRWIIRWIALKSDWIAAHTAKNGL